MQIVLKPHWELMEISNRAFISTLPLLTYTQIISSFLTMSLSINSNFLLLQPLYSSICFTLLPDNSNKLHTSQERSLLETYSMGGGRTHKSTEVPDNTHQLALIPGGWIVCDLLETNFIKYRIYSLFCKRDLSFINFEIKVRAISNQSQNTIIQNRWHTIRVYQISVASTFNAGEYYIADPTQEENQTNTKFANEIYWYSQGYRAHYSVCRTFVTKNLCALLFTNTLAKVPKEKKKAYVYIFLLLHLLQNELLCQKVLFFFCRYYCYNGQ